MSVSRDRIEAALMKFAHERGVDKTFCPSEVARYLADDWRPLMDDVREVAATLPLRVTQGGETVSLEDVRGPIRLSLAQEPD